MLPAELQDLSRKKPHLWDYLHRLPVEKIGVPQYHETLQRSLGDLPTPNLIYPVGNGIYIHVLPDLGDARNFYIAIEPGMNQDLSPVMDTVETRLVDYIGDLDDDDGDSQKRTQLLLNSLDKICVVRKGAKASDKAPSNGKVDSLVKSLCRSN